jgi:hypothetical protein
MPYVIGGKGDTLGCKGGYAVMNSETKEVIGCHPTRSDAEKHMGALYANVTDAKADDNALSTYPGVGIKRPSQGMATTSGGRSTNTTGSNVKSKYGKRPKKNRRGRSPDASNGSAGAIGAGGSSMSSL